MKRKATIGLLIMFFFPFVWQSNATSIKTNNIIVAPPGNDDCANATTLTVNSDFLCTNTTAGTVEDATATTGLSGCPGLPENANDDVWYKFVATDTSHKIELLNIAGSNTDLYYTVFDGGVAPGDCNAITNIFCGSTNPGSPAGLTIGNTYFINVFTNASASGANTTFDICIGSTPTVPLNDDCANAEVINLPFSTTSYDATAATNNSGFITGVSGCIDMNDGVWYTVTGDGGEITVTVRPSSWDAAIAIYEGSCGSFTCVDNSNVGGSGFTEAIVFNSTLNTEYYINIAYPSGTVDNTEGVFELEVTTDVLSIDQIVAKGFYYYPNPVKDVLKMNAKEPITQVNLYSILGKEIKKIEPSELDAEIDFSNLPTGTYFVKVVIGDSNGSFKIIKN